MVPGKGTLGITGMYQPQKMLLKQVDKHEQGLFFSFFANNVKNSCSTFSYFHVRVSGTTRFVTNEPEPSRFYERSKGLVRFSYKKIQERRGGEETGRKCIFFQGGGDSRCPITFDICRKIVKNHNIDRGQQLRKGKLKKQNNVKNRYFFYVKSKFGKKEKLK